MEIKEKTTFDAWKNCLKHIIDYGEDFKDSDSRICREVLNLTVTIDTPENDFELPIDSMKNFDLVYPAKEELASIILSKEQLAIYDFSYGPRIFNFGGKKDQINDFIVPLLKKDSHTRRAAVSLYDPLQDSSVLNKNIPSVMFIYFKIQKSRLNIYCFIRSNDYFIGWPGNVYQIFLLQRHVAEKIGMPTGSLSTISCSAHIFNEHFDMVDKIIKG